MRPSTSSISHTHKLSISLICSNMKSFALLSPTLRGRMTPLRAKWPTGPLGAATLPFHTAAPRAANDKSAQDKLVDERITAPLIQLVDPTSGQLHGPFKPQDILAKIDRKAYLLMQVTKGAMDDPTQKKEWSLRDLPICRLINKRVEYERQREKKKKPTSTQSKALTLSWNVSDHDLSHKLSKARRELERGHQVRVEISAKSGTPRALPGSQEADDRLQLVEHILSQLTQASPTSEATLARITSPPSWNRSRTLVAFVLQGSGAA